MTERGYVTDEAELLHDIRELLAILVYAQFSPPSGMAMIDDPKVREVVLNAIDPTKAPGPIIINP